MPDLATTQQEPQEQSLYNRVYDDVKDGAFGALLVGAVIAVWVSRTWGQTAKEVVSRFVGAAEAIVDTLDKLEVRLEELAKQVNHNTERLDYLDPNRDPRKNLPRNTKSPE